MGVPVELHEALSHIAEIRSRAAAAERFRGYRAVPVGTSGLVAVASTADGAAGEQVWVALQRGLTTDEGGTAGTARLGRYRV